ncbi:MAG: SRPBCC family protein [Lysobacter sp.]|nr:SRPBCC family protein [Lysobacter sp.]
MKIITEIVVDKPVRMVWDVLGNQFGNAHVWGSALIHTEGSGRQLSGQVCESRTCDIKGMGRIRENLLEFDPENFALKYEVVQGFPFFVERGVNLWTLTEEGAATRVRSVAEITTKGIVGAMMAPMMKMQMTGLMQKLVEDLKHYVETGMPHPRKLKAFASRKPAKGLEAR